MFFSQLELAPRDPILGLNEAFNADVRLDKVNLGVGVYYDENGKLPLLKAVQAVEAKRLANQAPRPYLGIEGFAPYIAGVQKLLFKDSAILEQKRAVTVQSLGGTGALKLGADFLKHFGPSKTVAISRPSWENHKALFEFAGFDVQEYTYYDANTQLANAELMLQDLNNLPNQSVVVLHACCHNPTGADLTAEDWQKVVQVCIEKQHIPFLDMAYQGFADNLQDDMLAVNLFAHSGLPVFIASSFSKSFSLYGERVGALTILTSNSDESAKVLSQLKRVIRTNYSNPHTHGAFLVASVLNDDALFAMWDEELAGMRTRIKAMRQALVAGLNDTKDMNFVLKQRGMFSYSGLTAQQVERLKQEFAIYAVSTGRICVAALNNNNITKVIDAIKQVI